MTLKKSAASKIGLFVLGLSIAVATSSLVNGTALAYDPYASGPGKSALPRDSFDWPKLKELVGRPGVDSIEKLLPLIPESYRGEYALAFSSRSLQEASFQNPRVLMYGLDASLVITFNGKEGQEGFHELEVMSFNRAQKKFEFREISFPNGGGRATISEANPAKCLRCHGTDPRPLWENYSLWPGFYGGEDDSLRIDSQATGFVSKREQEQFSSFWAARTKHPRYSQLAVSPARLGQTGPMLPNAKLGIGLTRLNFERIANDLAQERFKPYRYAIAASFMCFARYLTSDPRDLANDRRDNVQMRIDEFLPTALQKRRTSYETYVAETAFVNKHAMLNRFLRFKNLLGHDPLLDKSKQRLEFIERFNDHPADTQVMARLRFLLERPGYDLRTWSMSGFPVGEYNFADGVRELDALFEDHFDKFIDPVEDRDIYEHLVARSNENPRMRVPLAKQEFLCQQLKAKSIAALQPLVRLEAEAIRPNRTATASPVRVCAQCHESGLSQVPWIPFESPSLLKGYLTTEGTAGRTAIEDLLRHLKAPNTSSLHMPAYGTLSQSEIRSIEAYLRSLAPESARPASGR